MFTDMAFESGAGEWFCFRKVLQVLNKSVEGRSYVQAEGEGRVHHRCTSAWLGFQVKVRGLAMDVQLVIL